MGTVYSQRFVAVQAATSDEVYTVPAGVRAILRDVWAAENPSTPGDTFAIENTAGGFIYVVIFAGAQAETYFWQGRQVFEPGETIRFHVISIVGMDVTASGYLLSLP